VDDLLHAFFRAEAPVPWPTLRVPARDARRANPRLQRHGIALSSRFALAAAVALFVLGYWALSSRFPENPSDPGTTVNSGPLLGNPEPFRLRSRHRPLGGSKLSKQSGEALEPTRNGGEALLQWEQLPDGLFMRIEEKRPPRR
jgi:hypothetical protein